MINNPNSPWRTYRPAPSPGRYIPSAAVVRQYEEGTSARSLAAQEGVRQATMLRALRNAGVAIRPPGWPR